MSPGTEPTLCLYRLRAPRHRAMVEFAAGPDTQERRNALHARSKERAFYEPIWLRSLGGKLENLSAWLAHRAPLDHYLASAALVRELASADCPAWGEPQLLERAGELELPLPFSLPYDNPGKVLALGKNFREHAAEFGEQVPEEPLFFNKLPETLVPHGATVTVPSWYEGRFDHEAELAVVIARDGRDIALESAMDHVAGYTVANDLTLRSLQGSDRAKKHPWFRAKNFDGACPLGPCFVPRDFLDLANLRVTARVRHADGGEELRQDASTKDFVTDVPHAVAWLSRHMTLHTGDIVLMGTPAGVGPLVDGDVVTCAVEGIGELTTHIARPRA